MKTYSFAKAYLWRYLWRMPQENMLHLLACKDLYPKNCTRKQRARVDTNWKRRQDRRKTMWWCTVTAELKEIGLTWGEAQHAAQHRSKWR